MKNKEERYNMEKINKNMIGWILIIAALLSGVVLLLNSSILNPENSLVLVPTTLYKNILLFMVLTWIFVLGIILIKLEK